METDDVNTIKRFKHNNEISTTTRTTYIQPPYLQQVHQVGDGTQPTDRHAEHPYHGTPFHQRNATTHQTFNQAYILWKHNIEPLTKNEFTDPPYSDEQKNQTIAHHRYVTGTDEKSKNLHIGELPNDGRYLGSHIAAVDSLVCETRKWPRRDARECGGAETKQTLQMDGKQFATSHLESKVVQAQEHLMDRTENSEHPNCSRHNMGESGTYGDLKIAGKTKNLQRRSTIGDTNETARPEIWKTQYQTIRGKILAFNGDAPTTTTDNHAPSIHTVAPHILRRLSHKRTPQMLRRLLTNGTGSNDLSGGEIVQTKLTQGEGTNFDNLPIYAPVLPAIATSTIEKLLVYSEDKAAAKLALAWLSDADLHSAALRSIPVHKRKRFPCTVPAQELIELLAAGIIVPASSRKSLAFCRLGFIIEASKHRRRIILEPRDLNSGVETNMLIKLQLPQLSDVSKLTQAETVESIDFKSFYYQIAIDESIRHYYRLQINGQTFEVARLPQGARHSVGVAQVLTLAATKLACGSIPRGSLVYIDNIFIPHFLSSSRTSDSDEPYFQHEPTREPYFKHAQQPFLVGSASQSSTANVLGVIVDCKKKCVAVNDRVRLKLGELRRASGTGWTMRELLRIFGISNFILRVLHKPWSKFPSQLKLLSTICTDFISSKLNLDDTYPLCGKTRNQMLALMDECASYGPTKGDVPDSEPREVAQIISDASAAGWACILVFSSHCEVLAGEWKPWEQMWSINRKELSAIKIGLKEVERKQFHGSVEILTDSAVAVATLHKGHSLSTLNTEIAEILEHKNKIFTSWIPSEQNPADGPSRNPRDFDGFAWKSEAEIPHTGTRLWFDGNWSTDSDW